MALVLLLCSFVLVHAASSRQIVGNDLAEDLEQLLRNQNPENLAPVDEELMEDEVPESKAFEGDLLGIDKAAFVAEKEGVLSNAANEEYKKWPGGVVSYQLSVSYSKRDMLSIVEAMSNIQDNTCVQFRRKIHADEDYILLVPGISSCSSYPGRQGKEQVVRISKGCMTRGTILHEIMHVLGFYHEHTREDRDKYVEINYENIGRENRANFQVYNGQTFDLPYDYASVMHYKTNAFAKDSEEWTIRPVRANRNAAIGQRNALSIWDVQKINKLYNCKQAKTKVCGYLWTEPNFRGLMTVIYEERVKQYYRTNKRAYASAEILPGFEVWYFTEDAENGAILTAGQYRGLQPELQSRATGRKCVRDHNVELEDGS